MNYTLHQLQVFLKVAQTQSVTRAADDLNLTQPAVSIQLRNFQDQFDRPLIEVLGRKVYVTDFGHDIAAVAESILDQVATINAKAKSSREQLTGRLKLSIVSTGQYVMPFFLAPFIKQHGLLDLQMNVTNRARVIESLEQNSIDFALLSFLPTTPKVEKIDLLENQFYLIGNTERKFKKTAYPKQLLKELPLLFREKGSGTRQAMENFITRNKLSIIPKLELTSNEAVKQSVLAGLGYSIMPVIGVRNEIKNGYLQVIPVQGLPIKTVWRLVWLQGKKHSPVAKAFLEYMKNQRATITEQHFSLEAIQKQA